MNDQQNTQIILIADNADRFSVKLNFLLKSGWKLGIVHYIFQNCQSLDVKLADMIKKHKLLNATRLQPHVYNIVT
jgi:hypothetical protein